MKVKCSCGGVHKAHNIGTLGCNRKIETIMPRKIKFSDMWLVDGQKVTEYTLKHQRGYFFHPEGVWSSWRDSVNSLADA